MYVAGGPQRGGALTLRSFQIGQVSGAGPLLCASLHTCRPTAQLNRAAGNWSRMSGRCMTCPPTLHHSGDVGEHRPHAETQLGPSQTPKLPAAPLHGHEVAHLKLLSELGHPGRVF